MAEVSVQIPVYDPGEEYLRTCLQSLKEAAAKTRHNLQITILDDGSPDPNTAELGRKLEEEYEITYRRFEQNLGLAGAWNRCIEEANGEIVHILHQDDYVLPDFYERLLPDNVLEDHRIGAAFSRTIHVDESGLWRSFNRLYRKSPGQLENALKILALQTGVITCPSVLIKKDVYENIGGYRADLRYTLDAEFYRRLAANYSIWYEPQPFACYRVHSKSTTSLLKTDAADTYDSCKGIDISSRHYPEEYRKNWVKEAKKKRALKALNIASNAIDQKNYTVAKSQCTAALCCSNSLKVLARYGKIRLKYYIR